MPASLFTAENIVALLRAAADSDGTCTDVCAIASEFGGCEVSPSVLGGWLRKGRRRAERGMGEDAYAEFAREFESRLPSRRDVRNRGKGHAAASLRLALSEMETKCDCGRPKDRGLTACPLCMSLDGHRPSG